MKIIKAIITGVVLTTVVSCSSLDVRDLPSKENAGSAESTRSPDSQKKGFGSIGIYSPGDPLRGDLMLEQSLSEALYKRRVRNLTSSLLLPGSQNRSIGTVVKMLKRDNFEALLIIKNLNVVTESSRSPSGTVGNDGRETLILQKEINPLRTLTAQIEFIDLKSKNTVWTGDLTFKDANALPILIEKTADGIANHLANKNLIP